MAQIKKFSSGGRAANARARFEQVYANADQQTRALMDGYLQSTQNYAAADPMNNRSLNQFEAAAYENAIKMAEGNQQFAPIAGVTTKNIFNGYSRSENQDNANEIARRYLNQNTQSTASGTTPSRSGSQSGKYYTYSWSNGWDPSWGLEDDDLDTRLSAFTDLLIQNIGELAQYTKDGYTVKGYKGSKNIDDINSILNHLGNIQSRIGQEDGKALLKDLAKTAQKAGVDSTSFKDYFGEWLKVSLAEKNKKALLADGWSDNVDTSGNKALSDYLRKNKYSILSDRDGVNYIFDKDFNPVQNVATMYANSDWTNQNDYNTGYGVSADGRVWFGNVDDIQEGHDFYDQWNEYLQGIRSNRDQLFSQSQTPWNSMYGDSDNLLVNALSDYLNGKKFVDVGRLFNLDTQVLAVPKDGRTVNQDRYGNIKLDNMEFFFLGQDGNIHHATDYRQVSRAVGGFRVGGYDEADSGMSNFSDYSGVADLDSNIAYDRNYNGRTDFGNLIRLNFQFSKNIEDDPTGWASDVLTMISKGNKMSSDERAFLDRFDYHKDPQQITTLLSNIIEESGMWNSLSPQQKQAFQALLRRTSRRAQAAVQAEKQGGVVYAASGTTLGLDGDLATQASVVQKMRKKFDKEQMKAQEMADTAEMLGKDTQHYIAGQRNLRDQFTTADTLRFATMAQDVAGIVMSLTGLNAGSVALGFTAMGTDLAADALDESVSTGQLAKNALMNAGFAAVSWIPGAGLSKVTKNLIKYAPKVLAAASAVGLAMDDNVRNSWTKIGDPKQKLNVEDWKNIGHTLSALAGITRMGRAGYDKVTNRALFKGKAQQVTLKDGSKITISEKDAKDINTLLKSKEGGEELAINKLSEITGKTVQELTGSDLFKDIKAFNGIKNSIKGNGTRKVVGKELNTKQVDAPDYIKMAEVLAQEDQAIQQYANGNAWQRFQVKMANKFGGGAYTNKANLIRQHVAGMDDVPENISYVRQFNLNGTRTGAQNTKDIQEFLLSKAGRFNTDRVQQDIPVTPKNKTLIEQATKANVQEAQAVNAAKQMATESSDLTQASVSNPALNQTDIELSNHNKLIGMGLPSLSKLMKQNNTGLPNLNKFMVQPSAKSTTQRVKGLISSGKLKSSTAQNITPSKLLNTTKRQLSTMGFDTTEQNQIYEAIKMLKNISKGNSVNKQNYKAIYANLKRAINKLERNNNTELSDFVKRVQSQLLIANSNIRFNQFGGLLNI